jgi:hypothetical protein
MNIKITVLWNVTTYCLVYTCCLHLQGTKGNTEAPGSSEMLVLSLQTTWNHIPEDCNLYQRTQRKKSEKDIHKLKYIIPFVFPPCKV